MGDISRIDQLAAGQHGVFSLGQAKKAGFDKHAVFRRVDAGHWKRLDYRVLGLPSAAPTWERQMWIALLSRQVAVVGGTSAAFLHGFRGFQAAKPTIIVPGSANTRSAIARVVRAEHFDQLVVERVKGFLTTSIAETVIQLAGDLSKERFTAVFDDLQLSGRLDLESLEAIADREGPRRRRGIVLVRTMIDARSSTAPSKDSSYLERLLERTLANADLPTWSREHPFAIDGRSSRVDVYMAAWRLVVEADGRNWHMRHGDFETDRLRDNHLASQGIQVLRFTYQMLREDPDGCLETIRRVGRVRSAQGLENRNPML